MRAPAPKPKQRRQLLERLRNKKLARLGSETIERRGSSRAPLSVAQERIWFLHQLELGSPRFNILSAIRFKGRLVPAALAASLTEVVGRHEILRTTFVLGDGGPEQVISPRRDQALPVIDLTAISRQRREPYLDRFFTAETQRPIDLSRPLVRWLLLIIDPCEHIFCLLQHQIISDLWTRGIFVEEMAELYRAACEDRPPSLPKPGIQYADFAFWQRQGPVQEKWEPHLAYWRRQLREAPILEWPSDRPRPPISSYHGAMVYTVIPPPLLDRLKAYSQQRDVTLYMTLLAALYTLAYHYTGQRDMTLGTGIAHRTHRQLEKVMGFFVNMLALRCRVEANQSFAQLTAEAGRVSLEAYSHQEVPFEKVVAALVDGRDTSRHPLFQTSVVLQNTPFPPVEAPDLEIGLVDVERGTTAFDLGFFFWETTLMEFLEEGLSLTFNYSTDLFDETTARRLLGHLRALIDHAMAEPNGRLVDLALLGREQQHQLLHEWSTTAESGLGDRIGVREELATLPQIIERQAAGRASSVALVCGNERRTWSELNRDANRLAHHLRHLGIGPETPVAVCLPRGIETIVSFLAILKAGGFYVPLDPSLPPQRSAFLLHDAGAEVVITLETIPSPAGVKRLCLDEARPRLAAESARNLAPRAAPDHLAYVIYTSGSSGRPKGVGVSHRAVLDLVRHAPRLECHEGMAQLAETSFDASTFEIWAPLLAGARLAIVERRTALDAGRFRNLRHRQGIDVLFLTTPLFHMLAQQDAASFDDLRCLIFGGESPRPECVRAVRTACPEIELWHAYGPTEATTFATLKRIGSWPTRGGPAALPVPIGRPLPGTHLRLLDRRMRPVPIGVIGEIRLGGDGLARGYLDRLRETAGAFLPDPFATTAGARLYRTGDRGRLTTAGEIVFCGRIDGQLKVRGYRIEPEEIETLLRQDPEVDRVAVTTAVSPGSEAPSLVAHVLLRPSASPARSPQHKAQQLLAFLRRRLPVYMTPAAIAFPDALPLTASGKIDRTALQRSETAASVISCPFVAPRNVREQELAGIFQRVLRREEVGIYDDFFLLGGHSLDAVEVISELSRRQGRALDLMTLFERPTVVGLAELIESLDARDRG
jgi:amino acid adenylation domain-containing protein